MDWIQFIIFASGVFGCFFWNRSESRADIRHMDIKLDAYRLETTTLIQAIQQEMKDFHKRLERLDSDFKNYLMNHHEERNKGK